MSPLELLGQTQEAEYSERAHVYPFTAWNAEYLGLARSEDFHGDDLKINEPGFSSFEVATLKLPTAADRWIFRRPGHPRLTLEDVRAGRLPKPTSREIARRQEAIRMAREIRSSLDISPATTSVIIRRLRSGTETMQ